MSVEIMSRIWKQSEQSGTALIVLLALGDHADDFGICWPGLETIAKKARIKKRQAINVITKLEESGELICIPNRGRQQSNSYLITIGFSQAEIRHTLSAHDHLDLTPEQVELAMGKGATDYTLLKDVGAKGATDCTISGRKKVQSSTPETAEKVQSEVQKGAMAVAPEPSITTIIESLQESSKPIEGIPETSESSPNGANAPTPPPIPQATFPGDVYPDPADYTLKKIEGWVLVERQWRETLARERGNRKRKTVIRHIEQRLERKPKSVEVYRAEAMTYPEKTTWEMINKAVGDDPEDLNFWQQVVSNYIGHGWNKTNIVTMLKYYNRREIPGQNEGKVLNGKRDYTNGNGKTHQTGIAGLQYSAERYRHCADINTGKEYWIDNATQERYDTLPA